MLGINYLRSGIRRLAEAIHGLADTVTEANTAIRSRMALDGEDDDVSAVRRLPASGGTEEEVEAAANGEAVPAPAGKRGKK